MMMNIVFTILNIMLIALIVGLLYILIRRIKK